MLPALTGIALASVMTASPTTIDQIESSMHDPDYALAFLTTGVPPEQIRSLDTSLLTLERDVQSEIERIDRDPSLLTDPTLRQRRSELAVDQLRFRIPIARARLLAATPGARSNELAEAKAELVSIDFAWGRAALDRTAALGALHWRSHDTETAFRYWSQSDPSDALTRLGIIASNAALNRLEALPTSPAELRVAIAGAAHGRGPVAADALARRALLEASAATVPYKREAALSTLAALPVTPGDPSLISVARAQDPQQILPFLESDDALLTAEALVRVWTLDPDAVSQLVEASIIHPGSGARLYAAIQATPSLIPLEPALALRAARAYLEQWPSHALSDRWRLTLGHHAPPAEALVALDTVSDPSLINAAVLQAAIKSTEAFRANPSANATECTDRVRLARTTITDPALRARWAAWFLDAECEAVAFSSGLDRAAEILLAAPAEDAAEAALRLAPRFFESALRDEARGNTQSQQHTATVGAPVAHLALRPVLEARLLVLADQPTEALRVLDRLVPNAQDRYPAKLARAEACFALRRDSSAFPLYRQIAESHEANRRDTDAFWRSWTRMLQIIARQTDSAERAGDIEREIKRLKILDSQLGGDPHRRRLQLLLQSATTAPVPPSR